MRAAAASVSVPPVALLAAALMASAAASPAGGLPPTAAEASHYARTSTSVEVCDYVDRCVAASPRLRRLSMGRSSQGKDLPLVLVAEPPVESLAAARDAGRPLVFVFANIHAGEVEGKEAVQILLREFASGDHLDLLKKLTLAFVPDYNPDGNDRIDRKSRPDQAGPDEGVGQRANGMGLDLNRDYVKVEAPETQGLLLAVDALDPVLILDLHTTDGCFHGYDLTYAGIMHPACDPMLLRYSRERLLPAIRAAMAARGFKTFDYGDYDNGHPERGWSSFECKPRYGTNYFGFQNRLTLLSEAYSHAPFEERIAATRALVLTALEFASAHGNEMAVEKTFAELDGRELAAKGGAKLPTRGDMVAARTEEVLVGAVIRVKDAVTGLDHLVRTKESHPVSMEIRVAFEGRDERPLARGWLVERPSERLLALVARHGLAFERLPSPRRARVRVLASATKSESPRPFQGHALATFAGSARERDVELPAGALFVPAQQPRARLAFVLFEPESDDGLGTWGLLGLEPDIDVGAPGGGDGPKGGGAEVAPVTSPQRFEALRLLDWN
jgi:hypothetical protein